MMIVSQPSRSFSLFASHQVCVLSLKESAQTAPQMVVPSVVANNRIRLKVWESFDDRRMITPADVFKEFGRVSASTLASSMSRKMAWAFSVANPKLRSLRMDLKGIRPACLLFVLYHVDKISFNYWAEAARMCLIRPPDREVSQITVQIMRNDYCGNDRALKSLFFIARRSMRAELFQWRFLSDCCSIHDHPSIV
jgi:hypothetical protein